MTRRLFAGLVLLLGLLPAALIPAQAQDNIEERYDNAKRLFDRMVYLEQRFDIALKDLYADNALIIVTEIRSSGRFKTEMSGADLKMLIESYLPTAANLGIWYHYSNVSITPEGDERMRILASRTQHGTQQSFPYQLLVGPSRSGAWLIYEEQSIVQPQ